MVNQSKKETPAKKNGEHEITSDPMLWCVFESNTYSPGSLLQQIDGKMYVCDTKGDSPAWIEFTP